MNKKLTALLYATVIITGCTNNTEKESKKNQDSISSSSKSQIVPPSLANNSVLDSFWNDFEFHNTSRVLSPDYGEQTFVDFLNILPNYSSIEIHKAFDILLQKSSSNTTIQLHFEELFKKYFYDVNSPFYNEKYYIIALESIINSNKTSANSKIKHQIIYRLANRNNVGEFAEDFSYYYNNKFQQLYYIKDKYVILFFYEPGCSSCEQAINILKANKDFNNIIISQKVVVLAIYPDGNKNIWVNFKENIPTSWINGIDLNQRILKEGLYDLKASPTIYLLDNNKKVILKDTNALQLINHLNTL